MANRSSLLRSLLVAWRCRLKAASSRPMPEPSSRTRIRRRPPSWRSTSIRLAPASSAFSTSSFTTAAGRSITSPAAIWFARLASSRWMRGTVRTVTGRGRLRPCLRCWRWHSRSARVTSSCGSSTSPLERRSRSCGCTTAPWGRRARRRCSSCTGRPAAAPSSSETPSPARSSGPANCWTRQSTSSSFRMASATEGRRSRATRCARAFHTTAMPTWWRRSAACWWRSWASAICG